MEATISRLQAADEDIKASIVDTNSEVDQLRTQLDEARQYFGDQYSQTQEMIRYLILGFGVILVVTIFAIYYTRSIPIPAPVT